MVSKVLITHHTHSNSNSNGNGNGNNDSNGMSHESRVKIPDRDQVI